MTRIVKCLFAMVLLESCSTAPDSTKKANSDLPIRYPGPVKQVDRDRYNLSNEIDIPEECRNLTYCTIKPRDYPENDIRLLFHNTKVEVGPPELQLEPIIGNRQGNPDEEDDCPSDVSYEPIYKFKTEEKWQTVIQAPGLRYEQRFRMEVCRTTGQTCFKRATFPSSFRTKCEQNYSKWQLQVLGDDNQPVTKEIDLPSCCSCRYYYVKDTLS